jgi:hypothetical protein
MGSVSGLRAYYPTGIDLSLRRVGPKYLFVATPEVAWVSFDPMDKCEGTCPLLPGGGRISAFAWLFQLLGP